jgi:hypothetical protein
MQREWCNKRIVLGGGSNQLHYYCIHTSLRCHTLTNEYLEPIHHMLDNLLCITSCCPFTEDTFSK